MGKLGLDHSLDFFHLMSSFIAFSFSFSFFNDLKSLFLSTTLRTMEGFKINTLFLPYHAISLLYFSSENMPN